jgi:predicted membrane protein
MNLADMPKKKIEAISNGVFIICLGILFFTGGWWPGILLALWVLLAIRQYFTHRIRDLVISSIILLGLFALSFFNIEWSVILPVLFVIGGIYIIFREYFFAEDTDGEEKSQEIKDDVENGKKPT